MWFADCRTLHALKGLKELIRDTAEFLMLEDKSKYDPNERIFDVVSKHQWWCSYALGIYISA